MTSTAQTLSPVYATPNRSDWTEISFRAKLITDYYNKLPIPKDFGSSAPTSNEDNPEGLLTKNKTEFLPQNQIDIGAIQPLAPPYISTFSPLQEWEGYVVALEEASFSARLVDLTGGSESEQDFVDLPASELSETAWKNLKPGSVFRWIIGYELVRTGQKKRVSTIVVRDMPRWTATELAEAREQGKARAARLKWE